MTPAPWVNVVANQNFGFQAGAEGGGYSWSDNSRDFQLTAWGNDAVSNRPGEAFYVRDESSGALFGPTMLPIKDAQGTVTHLIVRNDSGDQKAVRKSGPSR